jgi:hypothetical protein
MSSCFLERGPSQPIGGQQSRPTPERRPRAGIATRRDGDSGPPATKVAAASRQARLRGLAPWSRAGPHTARRISRPENPLVPSRQAPAQGVSRGPSREKRAMRHVGCVLQARPLKCDTPRQWKEWPSRPPLRYNRRNPVVGPKRRRSAAAFLRRRFATKRASRCSDCPR